MHEILRIARKLKFSKEPKKTLKIQLIDENEEAHYSYRKDIYYLNKYEGNLPVILKKYKYDGVDFSNIKNQEIAEELYYRLYDFKFYLPCNKEIIMFLGVDEDLLINYELMSICRIFTDCPANLISPDQFFNYFDSIVKKLDLSIKLEKYEMEDLKRLGLNLFLSVNQGAKNRPVLLDGTYYGRKENKVIDLSIVGKGIIFDTGGINLKSFNSMKTMKCDKGGAATAAAILLYCAFNKLDFNINVTIPLTENIVDGKGSKPGDIFEYSYDYESYKNALSGETIERTENTLLVEVVHTDAEGRLILIDGIKHALFKYAPKNIFTVATLTGAAVVAFGSYYTPVFTSENEIDLLIKIAQCGGRSRDLCWPMPIFKNNFNLFKRDDKYALVSEFETSVGAIKNIGKPGEAGTIMAATFLDFFFRKTSENGKFKTKYFHFDIAGTAYTTGATGRPFKLFAEICKTFFK